MRRNTARGGLGFVGGLLFVASALGLPTTAGAQPAVCTGAVDTNFIAGPGFGVVGSTYTVTIDLGAGTISGTDPQFLDVNVVRYELDCQNIGAVGCTDEGEIIAFGGNLQTSADCVDSVGSPVSFSTTHVAGDTLPNTVLFTASTPVRIPEGKSALDADACQITFDLVVDSSPGTDLSPLLVQGGAGYLQNGTDATCTNTLPGAAQSSTQIALCQTGCAENDTDCETFECSTETGECVGTPVAASTPCDDVADSEECANPGCDGAGNCVATHIPEPDSTACTDTGLDCWIAGCEAGACVQEHTPEGASTPCDDVADTEECANPGCDGAGTCSPTHLAEPDSTACTDSDGNPCSVAGCEAGVCEQVHACEPDGKADCEITIGDFIWSDGNADGLQDAEPGIADVDLNLVECSSGEVVETTTTTDANGAYLFTVSAVTDLEACVPESRELLVQVDASNFAGGGALEGLTGSPQDVGPDDSVDSDCDPATHQTVCTAYPPGTNDLTVDCGYNAPGGCLTRTPGFWCTHPTVTALFLPVMSCGIDLTNVMVETPGSAIEDLNYGNDFKDAGTSPQQLQLIRQCAAAALNIAASEESGGSCGSQTLGSGETVAEVFDSCCGEDLCDSDASGSEISGSGCIELLDEFNNSLDTFGSCVAGFCEGSLTVCTNDDDCSPDPFDSLGSSMCPIPDADTPTLTDTCGGQPGRCQEANGNGFVNPGRDLGPGQSTGPKPNANKK